MKELYSKQGKLESLHQSFLTLEKKKLEIDGGFFKYNHTLDFDLTDLQICRTDDDQDYTKMCFIKALEVYGLDDNIIQQIKLKTQTSLLPMYKIKQIAEDLFDLYIT